MNEKLFAEHYQKRGFDTAETQKGIDAIKRLEAALEKTADEANLSEVKGYVSALVKTGENDRGALLALARYFCITAKYDIYIYFTSLFGREGVVANICERIRIRKGGDADKAVIGGLEEPPPGTALEDIAGYTAKLMEQLLMSFPRKECQRLLSGNNHGIPAEAFSEEKRLYKEADTLDEYLESLHARKVAELKSHADEGRIWYEQIITNEVVEFVAANRELLSAIREGNTLYLTKIPFDPVAYLKAENADERRLSACHCPFVKGSIGDPYIKIDPDWCYCSAGFEKYPFEIILGTELEAEVLESVLLGNDRCRFAVKLPEKYKGAII